MKCKNWEPSYVCLSHTFSNTECIKSPAVMIQISLFFLFNTILPGSDVGTDLFTSWDLYKSGHKLWAVCTFLLMWNPFIAHLLSTVFKLSRRAWNKEELEVKMELKHLMSFFPFVTPFKNLYYGIKLCKLGFGTSTFQAKDAKEVERIQNEAGSSSMYESFLESGPQSVAQLKIILSTGSVSNAQMVSIPISVASLAWASSRAYFIHRDKDNSDPAPELKMVLMYVFPWMLLIVAHSLLIWTCIAGLLGEYVFLCCFLYFFVAFKVQKIANKGLLILLLVIFSLTTFSIYACGSSAALTLIDHMGLHLGWSSEILFLSMSKLSFAIVALIFLLGVISKALLLRPLVDVVLFLTTSSIVYSIFYFGLAALAVFKNNEDLHLSFELLLLLVQLLLQLIFPSMIFLVFSPLCTEIFSHILQLGVPEVNLRPIQDEDFIFLIKSSLTSLWLPCVIGKAPYTFILSAVVSHIYKNAIFVLAVLLNYHNVLDTNIFLLWCTDESKIGKYEERNIVICDSLQSCFNGATRVDGEVQQKIRIGCQAMEDSIFFLVFYVSLLSLSALSLVASFQLHAVIDYSVLYERSKKFFGFKTAPVVHRSLVFTLAESDKKHEMLDEVARNNKEMINRPRRGETPLHHAAKRAAAKCAEVLLRNGAELKENGDSKLGSTQQQKIC